MDKPPKYRLELPEPTERDRQMEAELLKWTHEALAAMDAPLTLDMRELVATGHFKIRYDYETTKTPDGETLIITAQLEPIVRIAED